MRAGQVPASSRASSSHHLALYLIFVIWPYIQTFGYSFTDW